MKQLKVDAIKDGTVIDHIPGGKAVQVLKILGGGKEATVSIGMNLNSSKLGKKDIVKIENHELSADQVNRIAIIAPTASITIIRNYDVAEKRKVEIPGKIDNITHCPNPNCITNKEDIRTLFDRYRGADDDKTEFMCHYCERIYPADGLKIKVG
ncbi:MAG: aspartate carbamoyltransferase regulatory subunit [Spirochaetales bacterium]|uniref:Aspartate carbamoyltransferase regulatory chain n=1 Tax=Candidatus Thalassospirochaeta sargassi TaxID=3119039 RepID=A0AAJ1MM90_9SPIO|nr:aspartate carbamoyltransferase regulatory subunit [Spirochaetales bacterium]